MPRIFKTLSSSKSRKAVSTRSLIFSGISLLLSLVMFTGSLTVAWFAMNKKTESDGMSVQVKVSPNIIISDTTADLAAATSANIESRATTTYNNSTTYLAVGWNTTVQQLIPATHENSSAVGLKYNTNPGEVSPSTGLQKSSTALAFSNATSSDVNTYYVDYTVYIGALEEAITGQDLTVTIENVTPADFIVTDGSEPPTVLHNYEVYKALSVDFWVGSTPTYVGTLNLAGFDSSANNASTTKTSLTLQTNTTIPLNTAGNIPVTMRCYFDGALLKTTSPSNKAFVNSSEIETTNLVFKVLFEATDYVAPTP